MELRQSLENIISGIIIYIFFISNLKEMIIQQLFKTGHEFSNISISVVRYITFYFAIRDAPIN